MCGLTGYWLFDSQTESNSATILEMLRLQKHRGPDDSGIVAINSNKKSFEPIAVDQPSAFTIKPSLLFGFNRLSILDLSPNGHQPMVSADHSVILMMNGEVYNAFDFKEELIAKGITFKSHTDTEIVLNLYLMYGLQGMLDRLNGMYAIAIYDFKINKLFLIRDRLGIKPLYVLQEEGRLAFSSEMKSFKALPGFRFQLDDSGLSEFLLFRNLINKTLFKNIINIEPGHYMEINNIGEGSLKQYYDIRSEGLKIQTNTDEKLSAKTLKLSLQQAVKRQMISDVKLGCQLSGGVDSSLVSAYANPLVAKGSLETISIVFDNQRFSEKKYIDQVAEKLRLQSHQFTLTATDYMAMLEEATWHFEQPLNHPNTIGIKLLSREARKHVTVLLSGEGADEALAGYSRFLPSANKLWSRSFLGGIKKNRSKLLPFLAYWMSKDQRYLMQTAFGSISTAASLYPSFSYKKAVAQRQKLWDSLKKRPAQQKRKYELLTYLPDLLMRQDKMSMAHSIENRVPFLDNDMVSTALSLKDDVLIGKQNGRYEGKMLLKKLCADEFGEAFAFRNKMGFGIPLAEFFASTNFSDKWHSKLLPGIQKRALFNSKQLVSWAKKPQNLTPDQLDALWLMTGFELWAQQYLD
jgi:asparagine synthase (glutamine-hydrolysing)